MRSAGEEKAIVQALSDLIDSGHKLRTYVVWSQWTARVHSFLAKAIDSDTASEFAALQGKRPTHPNLWEQPCAAQLGFLEALLIARSIAAADLAVKVDGDSHAAAASVVPAGLDDHPLHSFQQPHPRGGQRGTGRTAVICRPFISYAKEDGELAERLYEDLRRFGADPWLDRHALRGGESWKQAIREALRNSTHVLTLISARSVSKTGFVQNELRQALEILDSVPPGKIFIVPVRLDDSTPRHEKLKDLHWIDLFPEYETGLKRIGESLDLLPEALSQKPSRWRVRGVLLSMMILGGLGVGLHYVTQVRAEPEVISDSRVLYPDGRRGSEVAIGVTIPTRASVLLTFAALEDPAAFQDYRVDLVDLSVKPPRQLWSRRGIKSTVTAYSRSRFLTSTFTRVHISYSYLA
jgi:hypothetical protein